MNTVREHFRFGSTFHFTYPFGYGSVGQQHEFLYQLVGIFLLLEINAERPSGSFFYFELHFRTLKVDGTVVHSFLAENLGHIVQHLEFLYIFSLSAFKNLLHFLVSEAAVTLYDGMCDV